MRTFTLNNYTYFHREFGCDQNVKENFSIVSGQNVIDIFLNLPPRKNLENYKINYSLVGMSIRPLRLISLQNSFVFIHVDEAKRAN